MARRRTGEDIAMELSGSDVQMLDRPGGRVAYEVAGDGPQVACAPGMGELRSSYRYTAPALTGAGFRVATMDLRGHGDSDATFDRYDAVAAGQDLLALVQHLGGSVVLVGNSMAAGAAVWAAAERPEAVAGLVLIGPFVRNAPTKPVMVAVFKALMSGPWAPMMWTSYLAKLYPGRKPDDFAAQRNAIAASMKKPGHRKAFTATTRTSHVPAEARIGDVRAPTLVVMGTADPDFPDPAAEARWIAERLDADVVMVPGAGHYPHTEYPEVVNPPLVRFCEQVTAGEPGA
jgi:pimeloyl-ACP methyl ester carboxylesterase